MTTKRGVNVKEWIMFGMASVISILGAFSAYVINDMRDDVQTISMDIKVLRDKYDSKFDLFAVTYVLKEDHAKDIDRIDDRIESLKQKVDNLKK